MLKIILKLFLYLIIFVAFVILLPGNILLDINPEELPEHGIVSLTGALKPNERLSKSEKLFINEVFGPESLAAFNGKVVTGCIDGFLYQIDGNHIKRLFKLVEKNCADTSYNTSKCGRPLGLKFDSKGTLFVVEPSVGVFSVENVFGVNPKVELVFDIEETSTFGKASKFLNDLAIDEGFGVNGGHVLYISDLSTKFDMSSSIYAVLGSEKGRIIRYDINAKRVESIAENLLLPNGVEITDDKNAILVNEFITRKVIKIYIKGSKKGESQVFVENLPGEPDNIRRSASKKETYWIALVSVQNSSKGNCIENIMKRPVVRKLVCRLFHFFGSVIEFIGAVFGNTFVREIGFDLKNGRQLLDIVMKGFNDYAMIVEIDSNGQIVDSLHANQKNLTPLSEVREIRISDTKTVLYLGSAINNQLAKLILKR